MDQTDHRIPEGPAGHRRGKLGLPAGGEIDRRWTAVIAAALVARRSPVAERRARILAGAIFGAMRATLAEWVADDGRTDLVRLGGQALSMFG